MSVTRKQSTLPDKQAGTLDRRKMLRLLGLSATTAYAAPALLGLGRARADGGGGTPGQGSGGSGSRSSGPRRKKKKKRG
jgi:hypothetical protein